MFVLDLNFMLTPN